MTVEGIIKRLNVRGEFVTWLVSDKVEIANFTAGCFVK